MCNQFFDVLFVDTIGREMLPVEVLAGVVNCCQQGSWTNLAQRWSNI